MYFDHSMVFKKNEGIHDNFLNALAIAEKELQNIDFLFPDIKCFLIAEDCNSVLITLNLKENMPSPIKFGFQLENENLIPNLDKIKYLQHNSWENLIFSTDISDFYNSWINYAPNIKKRAELLVEYLLINKQLNIKEMSMIEKINFEKNIKNHHKYQELYDKIIKFMPQIQSSLEGEWKEVLNSGEIPKINIKKKV